MFKNKEKKEFTIQDKRDFYKGIKDAQHDFKLSKDDLSLFQIAAGDVYFDDRLSKSYRNGFYSEAEKLIKKFNSKKFESNKLNRCIWSKDPKKRYNQCRHFLNNNQKYNLSVNDMLILQSIRNDAYNEYKR